jgi:hypothetical protein
VAEPGYVIVGYLLTAIVLGAYVLSLFRRAARASRASGHRRRDRA